MIPGDSQVSMVDWKHIFVKNHGIVSEDCTKKTIYLGSMLGTLMRLQKLMKN